MLKAKVRIQSNVAAIKAIQDATVATMDSILVANFSSVQTSVKRLTGELLRSSHFFNSFIFGDLRGHLGIPAPEAFPRIENVVEHIISEVNVTYTPLTGSGKKINGGYSIGIGKNGFDGVMNLASAKVTTENGDTLEWLEWVLTRGDTVIISDHNIHFEADLGRSGLAVMVPSQIASWRVPSAFSGTVNDNWITREIKDNIAEYGRRINNLISRKLVRTLNING